MHCLRSLQKRVTRRRSPPATHVAAEISPSVRRNIAKFAIESTIARRECDTPLRHLSCAIQRVRMAPKPVGSTTARGVPRRRLTKYPLWKRPRGQLEKALTHRDLHRHTSFDQPAVRPFNRSGSAQLAENPARMPQSPSKSEATLEGQKVGHSQTSQATNLITDENVERPESTTEKCKSARLRAAAVAFQGGSD